MNNQILLCELQEATAPMASQLDVLLGHLTTAPRPKMDQGRLEAIISNPHTRLFVALSQEEVVGSLTITHYSIPTGEKLWIEDVVVSPSARGLGVGRGLVEAAIEWGHANHPTATTYLTSNPSREAARNLYKSMGFEEYETGVFRLTKNL